MTTQEKASWQGREMKGSTLLRKAETLERDALKALTEAQALREAAAVLERRNGDRA